MLPGSDAGKGTSSSFSVNTARLGPNTASETDRGHSTDREYSTEVIYCSSDQDSGTKDNEDTGCSGGDRWGQA